MRETQINLTPNDQCTATFHQQLCVQFEATFDVDIECEIIDVQCLGPCEMPCVFIVTHPQTGKTATYFITFNGMSVIDGNSKWCYSVRVEGDPALSHWILELCCDPFPTIVPNSVTRNEVETNYTVVQPDKELGPGKCGIKFEEGVSENDGTVEYCFELEGQFDTVLRDVAAKGGPAPDVVNRNCLEGPDCP
jgi:hypothetical protein